MLKAIIPKIKASRIKATRSKDLVRSASKKSLPKDSEAYIKKKKEKLAELQKIRIPKIIKTIDDNKKLSLYNQGYRFVGSHSAIKVCGYCKKAITGKDVCYKQTFYNIRSHQCIQMTPTLPFCNLRCIWCWRDISHTKKEWKGKVDSPKDIVDGCIKEHIRYLQGFGGNKKAIKDIFNESLKPKHFAISLAGEPTFYPKLPELLKEIHKRGMTSFLVTNGTNPEALKLLLKKNSQPTQLYITLPAPDELIFKRCCNPLEKGLWKNIMESLALLEKFTCRKALRLTLVKDINMESPKQYAKIIKDTKVDFVELKAYMYVGYSRERLKIENMPRYHEIYSFAEKVAELSGMKIVDRKDESRVALLMKNDSTDRKLKYPAD